MSNEQLGLTFYRHAEVLTSENKPNTLLCEVLSNSRYLFLDKAKEDVVSDLGRFEQILRDVLIIQLISLPSPLKNLNNIYQVGMVKR